MAHDAFRERAEPRVSGRADTPSALPYGRAFVVQFGAETDARVGNITGRVEHLQTGRRSRFTSVDELVAWIMAMLASAGVSQDDG